jgi:hypothetical protein
MLPTCEGTLGGARPRRIHLYDAGHLAELEELLGRARREQMHRSGDDAGPTGLMAGAEAGPVVAVEVLVEQDEVAPVRIFLNFRVPPYTGRRPCSSRRKMLANRRAISSAT